MTGIPLGQFREQVEGDLLGNILPYWIERTVDGEHGGFLAVVTNDNKGRSEGIHGSILCARILWTFSAAHMRYGKPEHMAMADYAFGVLTERFWDKEHKGVFMHTNALGIPTDDRKFLYAQAFAAYGLAEYHRASGNVQAGAMARELFGIIEDKCRDTANGGYFELFHRDWRLSDEPTLSGQGDERKSMNTHLHLMEAYANLYRTFGEEPVRERLADLVGIFLHTILNKGTKALDSYFDDAWNVRSKSNTYGHDIEASWLIWEAAELVGDGALLAEAREAVLSMASVVLAEGMAEDGSILYEAEDKRIIDGNREWWPQAEAVVGFVNAYQLSGDGAYLKAAWDCWRYIDTMIVDHENGEWFAGRDPEGRVLGRSKVDMWKCPYHNGRMCMEVVERLDRLTI